MEFDTYGVRKNRHCKLNKGELQFWQCKTAQSYRFANADVRALATLRQEEAAVASLSQDRLPF